MTLNSSKQFLLFFVYKNSTIKVNAKLLRRFDCYFKVVPVLLEPRNRDGRYTMERVVEEDNIKDNLDTG